MFWGRGDADSATLNTLSSVSLLNMTPNEGGMPVPNYRSGEGEDPNNMLQGLDAADETRFLGGRKDTIKLKPPAKKDQVAAKGH